MSSLLHFPVAIMFLFHWATLDELSKMKVTCSSARVREKLDILEEKHDQAVLDMSEAYQVVTEKEAQVANLAEKYTNVAHIYTEICTKQTRVP